MTRIRVSVAFLGAGFLGITLLGLMPIAWCEEAPQAYLPEGPAPLPETTTTTICSSTTTTTACPMTTTTTQPVVRQCPEKPIYYGSKKESGYYKLDADVELKTHYCGPFYCPDGKNGECGDKTIREKVRLYCIENPYYDEETQNPQLDYTIKLVEGNFAGGVVDTDGDRKVEKQEGINFWNKFVVALNKAGKANKEHCYICGCFRGVIGIGEGCFAPGVQITMGDKSQKAIEKITAGEFVWNPLLKKAVKVARVIEGPEKLPLIKIGYGDAVVTVSQEHAMLTAAGLKPAKALSRKDKIYDQDKVPKEITILEQLPLEEGQRVINLTLESASADIKERMLLGNGIITGDLNLQEMLARGGN